MKASELIAALQALVAEHGDRRVFTWAMDESWIELPHVDRFDQDDEPSERDDQFQPGDFKV